jgi:hypothetical protein
MWGPFLLGMFIALLTVVALWFVLSMTGGVPGLPSKGTTATSAAAPRTVTATSTSAPRTATSTPRTATSAPTAPSHHHPGTNGLRHHHPGTSGIRHHDHAPQDHVSIIHDGGRNLRPSSRGLVHTARIF